MGFWQIKTQPMIKLAADAEQDVRFAANLSNAKEFMTWINVTQNSTTGTCTFRSWGSTSLDFVANITGGNSFWPANGGSISFSPGLTGGGFALASPPLPYIRYNVAGITGGTI